MSSQQGKATPTACEPGSVIILNRFVGSWSETRHKAQGTKHKAHRSQNSVDIKCLIQPVAQTAGLSVLCRTAPYPRDTLSLLATLIPQLRSIS